MQRTYIRKLVTIVAILALVATSLGILSFELAAHAKPDGDIPLRGQIALFVGQSHLLGHTNGQQQLKLSIGLHLRNQEQLATLLHDLYDPQSRFYHHFLTPADFAAQFGPTAEEQQQVVNYLQSLGFKVTHISNGLIDATGTVSQAESGFKVQINNYQLGSHHFFANANAPSIPASLGSVILSVNGLDNTMLMRPRYHLLNPRVHHTGPAGGYTPDELRGAYDVKALNAKGKNQTVAVFELDDYVDNDISQYLQHYNLGTPSITRVLVDGGNGGNGSPPGNSAIEDALDIEVIAAMAPQATQLVYEGPNTDQGVNDTYNQIVKDNKAQIISTSWGQCEQQSSPGEVQTLDQIFQQAAAQGITIYAASGDSGAYDCLGQPNTLAVDSPASDPYVTGVGGTTLQLKSDGTINSEIVWSNSSYGEGSGGGISVVFPKPNWQTGPGVQNSGNREVPDVSADADPNTGYSVYCTVTASWCNSSGWIVVGGTSGSAPLWAGSTAAMNEYLQNQGKARLGSANPAIYGLENATQLYKPFINDITAGNNLHYPATANYDLASGWGSPDVYNLARDIANGNIAPPPPPPPATGAIIQDGGFEDGPKPTAWTESSSGGFEIVNTKKPHTGKYSADLCGYINCKDSISQSFSIPASSSKITIDFWWYGKTTHGTSACKDKLSVLLLDSSGNVIKKIRIACNTDAKSKWKHKTLDVTSLLASYAGKTVTLEFEATTTSSQKTTRFFVDDVAMNAS